VRFVPASRYAPVRTVSAWIALACVAVMAAAPTPDAVQVQLCIATIAVYFLMGWLRPSGGPLRSFVALLIIFTSTRYMIWRVTETMPVDSPLSIVGGIFLLGAETYGYILLLLSTFLSVDVYKRGPRPVPVAPDACRSPGCRCARRPARENCTRRIGWRGSTNWAPTVSPAAGTVLPLDRAPGRAG